MHPHSRILVEAHLTDVMLPRPTSHSTALGPGVTGPSLAHPGPGTVDVLASNAMQFPSAGGKPFVVQYEAHSRAGRPRQHTQCADLTCSCTPCQLSCSSWRD